MGTVIIEMKPREGTQNLLTNAANHIKAKVPCYCSFVGQSGSVITALDHSLLFPWASGEYLALVVLAQLSVLLKLRKQIKHNLRLWCCCPLFLLLTLHQLWRPYSCRQIGPENCLHWKMTFKEEFWVTARARTGTGMEIRGWSRVEFGTASSQQCTVQLVPTGCESAE